MALVLRLAAGFAIAGFTAAASAGNLEDGIAAFKANNFPAAASKLVPLAEKGVPEAQFYSAQLYFLGNGVQLDLNRALDLMRASADRKYEPAQLGIIGYMYVMYGMSNMPSRFTRDELKKEYWRRIKIAFPLKPCDFETRNLVEQFIEINPEYRVEWQQMIGGQKC